jgi:anthranilate synthase component 2
LKVLLVDFYDSFTYNLLHYLEALGAEVIVLKNDKINMEELPNFDRLVFSPGPGLPSEKLNFYSLLDRCIGETKMLGVCLGMQGIAEYLGAELYNMDRVKHGVSEVIEVDVNSVLFQNCQKTMEVGLYHSWAVKNLEITGLKATATAFDKTIMAFENTEKGIYGVQFHPESILTENGKQIFLNFLAH